MGRDSEYGGEEAPRPRRWPKTGLAAASWVQKWAGGDHGRQLPPPAAGSGGSVAGRSRRLYPLLLCSKSHQVSSRAKDTQHLLGGGERGGETGLGDGGGGEQFIFPPLTWKRKKQQRGFPTKLKAANKQALCAEARSSACK